MTYGLCGTIVAAPGQRDELVRVLLDAATSLEADTECLEYVVGVAGDDEVAVFETWESAEAHAASLQREEIRALVERAKPLIAGMGTSIRFDVRGGKGSASSGR